MEFQFQPDLFERGRVDAQFGSTSIRISGVIAANGWAGRRRGRIN
jgi:hypothetical protein